MQAARHEPLSGGLPPTHLLYVGSHSILEYDEVRLFDSLGFDVFSIGSYTDPANPSDDKRPAITGMTYHADLANLCQRQRERHTGEDMRFYIDPAKSDLHADLIDWADMIMFAAFPEAWIVPQWPKLRGKRVIWRTIGQSDASIEQYLTPFHPQGLEIVRYSPKEKAAFESIGVFAGEDAMIRFAKDPADWFGWVGDDPVVANVTQDMAGRGEYCGYSFWLRATEGLPARPAGPKSDSMPGGLGALTYEAMRAYLRHARSYLYTGTQPASYTLGFIEALMTGTPVIAMAAERFGWPAIYEADDIALRFSPTPENAHDHLAWLLRDEGHAGSISRQGRERAIELFGVETIREQWAAYLGAKVAVAA